LPVEFRSEFVEPTSFQQRAGCEVGVVTQGLEIERTKRPSLISFKASTATAALWKKKQKLFQHLLRPSSSISQHQHSAGDPVRRGGKGTAKSPF
jgi:hypothetical protein